MVDSSPSSSWCREKIAGRSADVWLQKGSGESSKRECAVYYGVRTVESSIIITVSRCYIPAIAIVSYTSKL